MGRQGKARCDKTGWDGTEIRAKASRGEASQENVVQKFDDRYRKGIEKVILGKFL